MGISSARADAGDVAPEQTSTLFDVALAKVLLFAKFAELVADDHDGIVASRRLEGKNEAGLRGDSFPGPNHPPPVSPCGYGLAEGRPSRLFDI
jgi:hypothetical protein